MTTPNTIIADLAHEIDRLQKVGNLMLETLISAESIATSSWVIFCLPLTGYSLKMVFVP